MDLKGKLYGIGTGPGDPELLTLKAINTLEKCDVIALPNSGNNEKAAFGIVEKYLTGKSLLECRFSMEKDEAKRKGLRIKVADDICKVLEEGKNVGFITLGDPTVYSTYMYIHKLVMERGFATQIISGIPSFIAAAAALNTSLCEGNETLHIIPASDNKSIDELLALPGNKVIMKSGKSLNDVLLALGQKGLSEKVKIVMRCTMDGERVFNNADELQMAGGAEYFTVALIKS